jgi:Kef-type K+ transport system membrane component KefB
MQFLPSFPLDINAASLFGITLLLGVISGELAKRFYYFPKISGYIAVGFLVGPSAFNIVTPSLLFIARIFVDISLGLILFELGRHLDIQWLRRDPGILKMSVSESSLTFILIFAMLMAFQFPWLHAALAATIAIATAPSVVLMVADDLSSKGPVTRRTMILTSLNNLFALLLFTLLLPMTQTNMFNEIVENAAYRIFGSLLLGIAIFIITMGMALLIGKRKENQFILFVGCVMFSIGFAETLKLSSMLVLFTLGVAARNLNFKYLLTEVDFGWFAKLFFILLFVITGVHLHLRGLWEATWIVLAFILIRVITKSCGIWLFAKSCKLNAKQSWSLCLSLTPMAGLAVGMSNIILDFNPDFGYNLIIIITTSVAILNIIGPVAVQFAFIRSREAISDKMRQ